MAVVGWDYTGFAGKFQFRQKSFSFTFRNDTPMLLFISLFLGRRAQRTSRPSFLVALVLVMRLLLIDVIVVNAALIQNEIYLHPFPSRDGSGDMGVFLTVGKDNFGLLPRSPKPGDRAKAGVFLGHAYFANSQARESFVGRANSEKPEQMKNYYQSWTHVGRIVDILFEDGSIKSITLNSWLKKLQFAKEKETKIDQETWYSWRMQLEQISLVKFYYGKSYELSGKVCLMIGSHSYCLDPQLAENAHRADPLPIGFATFANVETRNSFHEQVTELLKTTEQNVQTWINTLKEEMPENGKYDLAKPSTSFKDWALIHEVMTLGRGACSGLDEPSTVITEDTLQKWKGMISTDLVPLEEKKALVRVRNREQATKRRQDPVYREAEAERYRTYYHKHRDELIEKNSAYRKQQREHGGPS
ncbi:hypothetical protein EV361DRAFT_947347 [Lentinula raphanica]|nr:hypothetical protein EV361DRAFT_947347 [Lentinula raphanica]